MGIDTMKQTEREYYVKGVDYSRMYVPYATIMRIMRKRCGAFFDSIRFSGLEAHRENKASLAALLCALYILQTQILDKDSKSKSGAVYMCGRVLYEGFSHYAHKFLVYLSEDEKTSRMFKHWYFGKRFPEAYRFDVFHNVELQRLTPELNKVLYDKVVAGIEYFFKYIDDHRKELPEEMKEFANNYYKYRIDMNEAVEVSKKLYGMTFDEAREVLRENKVQHSEKVMLAVRVLRDENLCKVFNSGDYCVRESYGRLYTPFHRIPSTYRSCIYLRGENAHEHIQEKCDMSGAFVTGTQEFMSLFALAQGKKKLHDKLNHIISVTDDPYAFAVDDKHERKAVKAAVVSTLFASPTQIRTRLRLNARYGSDEVVKAAQNVMDFLEKNQYLSYVSVKVLNKVCEVLRNDTSVLTAMYPNMKLPKRITFTAKTDTKMYTGKVNFKEYVNLCKRIVSGYWTKHVKDSMVSAYGEDVWEMFDFVNCLTTEYSNSRVRLAQNLNRLMTKGTKARVFYKKDLSRGNVVNISTICQKIEGEAMFKDILPNLKFNLDCDKLVSLHDSVWGPESVDCSGYLSNRTMKEAVHMAAMKFMKGKAFKNLFKFWTNGMSMYDKNAKEWIDMRGEVFAA